MYPIEAHELRKEYHAGRGRTVEAVQGATFQVEAGEIFGLLGPNGAGKTTLLRMLGTIITPTSGRCTIAGESATESPDSVRRHIGFLSGNTKLYGRMRAREVLAYFGRLYRMDEAAIENRLADLAGMLDMAGFLERRCDALSTGQLQRVSIARVLMHEPPVLILDEPTLGLDIMTSAVILDFIRNAKPSGYSIIFSTHYMTEAESLCDRIALMHQGRILAVDAPKALCATTGQPDLQNAFLHLIDQHTVPA